MNAVEIEEAISELAAGAFDPVKFPFQFLAAFGNNEVTLKRLQKVGTGGTNYTDLPGAVLQRNHIHLAVCRPGAVRETIEALRASAKNRPNKVKLILATDGEALEAEYLATGEPLACPFVDLANHFGFFLPFAGITTIQEIKDNPIDVRATGRLNKLYVELLANNPEWDTEERRSDMNHFMARLIFCFFAEDTDIFHGDSLFTRTVDRMTTPNGSDTNEVLEKLFAVMNLEATDRPAAGLPNWVQPFPYVNGGLFSDSIEVPRFTRAARSYLLRVGELNWRQINPDIFGSMIQAVADKEQRGALGMHYTSVPNILRVLNPLFLDDLRAQLEAAADNKAKLLNLRKRMAHIRVFDPACGSGNFLVIAYKEMRKIEWEINRRREEEDRKSDIPINNYRGIELNDFPAEIARLALIIAQFQCDVLYRGQQQALATVLPLDSMNWITRGNALQIDWLSVCPPTGTEVNLQGDDLFTAPTDQSEIDFENEGGETYLCGNPPYVGSNAKPPKGATKEQKARMKREAEARKADMKAVFNARTTKWGSLDYVAAWFMKAADYGRQTKAASAFVSTNSICQGRQVATLWPMVFDSGHQIAFAHTSFKWKNLAAKNAGVSVVIVGISNNPKKERLLYTAAEDGTTVLKTTDHINAYLLAGPDIVVEERPSALSAVAPMNFGNMANDGGGLLPKAEEVEDAIRNHGVSRRFIRPFLGSEEAIDGKRRYCIWVDDAAYEEAAANPWLAQRFAAVRDHRESSDRKATQVLARTPYKFGEVRQTGNEIPVIIPRHSSENREYLPFAMASRGDIVADSASALFDAPIWNVAIFASRLHLVWIATVCGKLETRYRYSNTLGWNTFPLPILTDQQKIDLKRCAEDILLARETHYPKTIAELYDKMPEDLRRAHERNDEVLERIYIGRRFRNDTERLETLFNLYTKMTAGQRKPNNRGKKT
jgi:hypothetical protein